MCYFLKHGTWICFKMCIPSDSWRLKSLFVICCHDKLYCYTLDYFLWEYLQSIKIGINTGKAWGSLDWLNQSYLCLATQKLIFSHCRIESLEMEEEEPPRHLVYWSLEDTDQLVLSHHDNRKPSGMTNRGTLVTSTHAIPECHPLLQIILAQLCLLQS